MATVLQWLASHRWIHRRSESMRFEDANVGSRALHVSFTIPKQCPRFDIDGRAYCCLPISLLRKQKVNLFSLTDEEGIERPLLTRSTRGDIAADGLVRMASALIAKALQSDLPADLEADIRVAARGKPIEAITAMRRMEGESFVADPVSAACRALLMGYETFRLVMWSLALNSMILVRIPYQPGAPKTLTAEYDEPLNEVRPGAGLARLVRTGFRTAGLTPKKLWFPARVLPEPSSNHYRVAAPDGLQVSAATLAVGNLESPSVSSPPRPGAGPSLQQQIGKFDEWKERDRETGAMGGVHLYDRELPEHTVALVRVNLRPTASGTLRAIWLTSAVSLGLLVLAGEHLKALHGGGQAATAAQSASALLLLIPTLLSVYVARPGEHTFTSELLFGTRILGLVAGGTTLLAACYLVLTDPSRDLGGNWALLLAIAGTVFGLLTVSSLINWAMRYPERDANLRTRKFARARAVLWVWIRQRLG